MFALTEHGLHQYRAQHLLLQLLTSRAGSWTAPVLSNSAVGARTGKPTRM